MSTGAVGEQRDDPLRRQVAKGLSRKGLSEYKRLPDGQVAIRLVLAEPLDRCEAIEVFCVAPDLLTATDALRACGLRGVHRPKVHGSRIDEQALSEWGRLGPPFVWRQWSSEQGPWRHAFELSGIESAKET